MLTLTLLRHAKSDPALDPRQDHERPINARGQEAAHRIGHYFQTHHFSPDLVLVSSAVRAAQTWEVIHTYLPHARTVTEPRLYQTSSMALLRLLRDVPDHVRHLTLVGHNPSLEDLAHELIAMGDMSVRDNMNYKFPTCAFAHIRFAVTDWTMLHPDSGRLEQFIAPKQLEHSTE